MEEALHDMALFREFAQLDAGATRLPDESTILRFRHFLEAHQLAIQMLASVNAWLIDRGLMLKTGRVIDATLIAAPTSTKNSTGERDPEMHQTKKGNQWDFGMKAHIGADADSSLVHSLEDTAANAHDITKAVDLLHGQETDVFGDAGYKGIEKRAEAQGLEVQWHVAMRPGKRRVVDKTTRIGTLKEKLERLKASIRAKVEHPFRVIKCQFG